MDRVTTDILLVVPMKKISRTRIGYSLVAAVCMVLLLVTFPTLASCDREVGRYAYYVLQFDFANFIH